MFIEGANNPGNKANVDGNGNLGTHAVSVSQQTTSAQEGDAYNLNTGTLTLTSAVETPVFYLKNDSEERDLVVSRVFMAFGTSTGGSGEVEGTIYYNPTGGTIISGGTDNPPANFNASSSKTLAATSKTGASGQTFEGGTTPIRFFFPSDGARSLTQFESIVLPRGASMVLTITPPTDNTSIKVQAGANIYLNGTE